jgi:hypothetical protein
MRVQQERRMTMRLKLAYVVMTILLFTPGCAKSPAGADTSPATSGRELLHLNFPNFDR